MNFDESPKLNLDEWVKSANHGDSVTYSVAGNLSDKTVTVEERASAWLAKVLYSRGLVELCQRRNDNKFQYIAQKRREPKVPYVGGELWLPKILTPKTRGRVGLAMSTFEPPPSTEALRDLREISPFQADEGELVGRDPREVSSEILCLYHREKNPLKALRARCLDCCCGVASEVRKCTAVNCPSWPFRMGTNPFREKRVLSAEQKRAVAERLARARVRGS